MTRLPILLVPALLFGGLLFAQPAPMPPPPPVPPPPPSPVMPSGHHHGHDDISINMHDGKIEVDGIKNMVDEQLQHALESLDSKDMPPQVREKLRQRLNKVRHKVDRRLGHMNAKDLDELGEQLNQLGEDIGHDMEGFGSDMERWGDQFGKNMEAWGKQFQQRMQSQHFAQPADPDDMDMDMDSDSDSGASDGDADYSDAVRDLADVHLRPDQRDQLRRLRADSDRQIAANRQALAAASQALHDQLASGTASDAEIARAIDAVSQQEAAIRKARILTWVNARRVLDDGQRRRVEGAFKGRNK